jgi:hypothetical protein
MIQLAWRMLYHQLNATASTDGGLSDNRIAVLSGRRNTAPRRAFRLEMSKQPKLNSRRYRHEHWGIFKCRVWEKLFRRHHLFNPHSPDDAETCRRSGAIQL